MNAHVPMIDAQVALGYVLSQRTAIEGPVLRREFPEITYARLVPVDMSVPEFAPSVTFFTSDPVGRAKFINGQADDIPLVDNLTSSYAQSIYDAGVAYQYSFFEIGAARQYGYALDAEKVAAARLAYENLVEDTSLDGNAQLGVEGLFNMTGITSVAAGQTFAAATPAQILATINGALTAIMVATNGMDVADTVILPLAAWADLATRTMSADNAMTVLEFIQRSNVYTARTGRPLTIEATHRLTTKMVVYRRDPSVLKLYMPMPLQFLPPQVVNLMTKSIGVFRFSPVNIRRPAAVRYVTGVAA